MPWYKHPVAILVVYLTLGAGNAFVIQLAIDVQAGRVPVDPALLPYVPSFVAAAGFVTTVLIALLPAMWKTIQQVWHLATDGDQ